jgi:hypothetical protein
MKVLSILLSLCLALMLLPSGSWALEKNEEGELRQLSMEETMAMMDMATKFTEMVPGFPVEDAIRLAQLVHETKEDDETKVLLEKLKKEDFAEDNELQKSLKNAGPKEIVSGMIQMYQELKAIDILFKDPKRAVEEVSNEGMIADDEKLQMYRENPARLEADMRSGLYFSFVYIASIGGYL